MKTLTLEQTLHPEWTDHDETPGTVSPWETFFREARGDIPIAIAEPVEDDVNQSQTIDVEYAEGAATNKVEGAGFPPSADETEDTKSQRSPGKGCFYLEGVVGSVLSLAATLIVFSLELCGAIVYILAVGFNILTFDDLAIPGLFKAIFSLVAHILMLVDSVCLFCSVIVSEVLACATSLIMLILCAFSGDCVEAASQWHQYVRKMSHLSRWSFRSFHHGWKPERVFPMDFSKSNSSESSNGQAAPEYEKDDDPTVLHVSAASFIVEEGSSSHEPHAHFSDVKASDLSISRAPPTPGERGSFIGESSEISAVMPDVDAIIVDVEGDSSGFKTKSGQERNVNKNTT